MIHNYKLFIKKEILTYIFLYLTVKYILYSNIFTNITHFNNNILYIHKYILLNIVLLNKLMEFHSVLFKK